MFLLLLWIAFSVFDAAAGVADVAGAPPAA